MMNWPLTGAPWLITHRQQFAVNQPKRITLAGVDYVLWKNTQREIAALENRCPHMEAKLDAGWVCGENNTLSCPFTLWNVLPKGMRGGES